MNGHHDEAVSLFTTYVDNSFAAIDVKTHSPEKPHSSKSSTLPGCSELDELLKGRDEKKIKRFIRSSNWPVNHEVRATLWKKLCCFVHGARSEHDNIYAELLTDIFGEDVPDQSVSLPSFVDAAHLKHYHLSDGSGVPTARRLLCVLAHERPDIVYSPALFSLVCLLLHYMSEVECHFYVSKMIRSKERYFAQTRAAHEAWPLVLHDLAKKYASSSYKQIMKSGIAIDVILENWIWWILEHLPFAYMVRVIDVFLCEGLKFLYRVALAILILYKKFVAKESLKSTSEFAHSIEQFCTDITVPVDKLFKTAFGLRGLSRSEIRKVTLKKEIYVQSKHNVAMLQNTMPQSPSAGSLNAINVKGNAGSLVVGKSETDGATTRLRSNSQDADYYPSFHQTRSAVMAVEQWRDLYNWLPRRFTLKQPKLLFSTAEHGTSLSTFYNRVEGHEPTFIAIKTRKSEVIGAYCSVDWVERKSQQRSLKYFGTGESFICKFLPPPRTKYSWVGIALGEKTPNTGHLFMCGDVTQINLGGGSGIAIMLDENLLRGSSERCDTYDNAPLVDGGFFDVTILEAFAFD